MYGIKTIMDKYVEKRKDRRLDLHLGVEFKPGHAAGVAVPFTGTTRNVSVGGVYFETPAGVPIDIGTDLLLEIAIPRRAEASAEPMVLNCQGRVCRLEQQAGDNDTVGVAVQFDNRPNIEFQSLSRLLWDGS